MIFTVLCIGKIKEKWTRMGIEEYVKRLSPMASLQFIEYNEEKMPKNASEAEKRNVLEKEGEKILRNVKENDFVILLDLKGKLLSSEELAAVLSDRMVNGTSHFFFMIGGPYGNGSNIQKRADIKISMGHMTFTHQMARLLLSEQLYRAMKIIRHEPYHL